jgi:hypothetical protein
MGSYYQSLKARKYRLQIKEIKIKVILYILLNDFSFVIPYSH